MPALQSHPERSIAMERELPAPVWLYLQQENMDGAGNVEDIFAPDAEVRDEGRTIHGLDAIRAWKLSAKARYRYRVEPLSAEWQGADRLRLRVRVAGDFPGSPVVLEHAIALADGRIASLEIG